MYVRHLSMLAPLILTMATHSRILPGEFHGQRRLAGYNPWGRRVRHDRATDTFTFFPYYLLWFLQAPSDP